RTDGNGQRTGIWFVGARGSVATTATIGIAAMGAGLAPRTGLVSELGPVATADLPPVEGIVTGGHDIVDTSVAHRAQLLAASAVFPGSLVSALAEDLARADSRVRLAPRGETQRDAARAIEQDIRSFRQDNDLDRVVVVDVSNTEPPAATR